MPGSPTGSRAKGCRSTPSMSIRSIPAPWSTCSATTPRASLLGTDALRDGVDVPGRSLRLVVMEGVPWPKPTVLHAARRLAGGGSAYDDRIVRARLAQAFGRLIRRADDHGAFILLSAAMPSRLLTAFPPGVAVRRVTLDEAVIRAGRLPSVTHVGHEAREEA